MRPIKFRAWDKNDKRMIRVKRIVWWSNRIDEVADELCVLGTAVGNVPNFELMQFTGLLDKNGKEIYEGDILIINDVIYGVVQFKFGMFVLGEAKRKTKIPVTNDKPISYYSEHEVIGNVWENPELIKIYENKKISNQIHRGTI